MNTCNPTHVFARCERRTVWEGEWRWHAVRAHATHPCTKLWHNHRWQRLRPDILFKGHPFVEEMFDDRCVAGRTRHPCR